MTYGPARGKGPRCWGAERKSCHGKTLAPTAPCRADEKVWEAEPYAGRPAIQAVRQPSADRVLPRSSSANSLVRTTT